MAISAVMLFDSDGDVRAMYDATVEEMGIRDNPPRGLIHHWCAPVSGGLRICDVWETREDFERFAKEKIGPIATKHGMPPAVPEITPIHEMIHGNATVQKGTGFFIDAYGDTIELLRKIDDMNRRMNIVAQPPDGLAFHCTIPAPNGIRVIDHWRSTEDFERFVDTRLGATIAAVGLPQPRITSFEVYNTLTRTAPAKV